MSKKLPSSIMPLMHHTVHHQAPLLAYLLEHFKDLKRTKIKSLLKFGAIEVNGHVTTRHDHPLQQGDTLRFLDKKTSATHSIKSNLPFPILFEDNALIVIKKPPGLLTMGTEHDKVHTAYYLLTDYVRNSSPDEKGRVFIVHRLDRDASGLLVFAKTETAKLTLQQNWTEAVKKYFAVVHGVPKKPFGTLESHLVEDKFRRVFSTSKPSPDSKHAVTHYELLRHNTLYSLLDITLETGRKNQIRVHLADLGHPIVGDAKYGNASSPSERLALHAYLLNFEHPVTGRNQIFQDNLPQHFSDLLV